MLTLNEEFWILNPIGSRTSLKSIKIDKICKTAQEMVFGTLLSQSDTENWGSSWIELR